MQTVKSAFIKKKLKCKLIASSIITWIDAPDLEKN